MAQQNFAKLAAEGRGYDATRGWTEEELESLLSIESEGVQRKVAAGYVRNGIRTVEEYKRALATDFKPKTFEELQREAVEAHMASVRDGLSLADEPEVVVEPVVVEPEAVAEPEVAVEPEVVVEEVVVEPEVVVEKAVEFPKATGAKRGVATK
jgi:UDP-3-O-[3-hydroxymyristoyl] glucosamine N-acyltransferase